MPMIAHTFLGCLSKLCRHWRAASLSLFLGAAFTGCSTYSAIPELPEKLGVEGVVIGQLVDVNALKGFVRGVILTNGKEITLDRGYFAAALAPGNYQVKELYTHSFGMSMKVQRSYPLNLPFTVKEKQVTNLGALVFLPADGAPDTPRFLLSRADNSSDIPRLFRKFYPQLIADEALMHVNLAEGSYLNSQQIESLRRHIVTKHWDIWKKTNNRANTTRLVADEFGTFARVRYDAENKIADLKIIDMGGFSNLMGDGWEPMTHRYAAISDDQRFFIWENDKLVERSLSAGNLQSPSVHPVGAKGLVITDSDCVFYTSQDDGGSWVFDSSLKKKKCGYMKVASGSDGYYVYIANLSALENVPAVVLYSPHGQRALQPMPMPAELKQIRDIQEHAGKLFVESNRGHDRVVSINGEKSNSEAYFVRGIHDTDWKQLSLPSYGCSRLIFLDAAAEHLRISCSNDWYESQDSGRSWQPAWLE